MKVAIIGSGISGLTSAFYLKPYVDITVFEKAERIGGHTATMDVELDARSYQIDTGFIVYNERTYPNFIRLLTTLGIATQKTEMGFSVSTQGQVHDVEYSGGGLNGFFSQRKNIFSRSHWKMLFDIIRFNRQAPMHLEKNLIDQDLSLGEYLNIYNYSDVFRDYYLVPMGSAIWSASTSVMMSFPMQFFIKFFNNHGLLQIFNRPQWYVISGGSKQYIAPLTDSFKSDILLNQRILHVKRSFDKVLITLEDGSEEYFDDVIFACHSDEALALLDDVTDLEKDVVGSIHYQSNDVVLHYDQALLPSNKIAWSSWNYRLYNSDQEQPTLTYNMNILQGIDSPITFCVTLNDSQKIDKNKIIASFNYAHPVFTQPVIDAQKRWSELTQQEVNGHTNNTWFAGAYWRNGFHEDGVYSGIRAANMILKKLGKATIDILEY